MLCLLNYSLGGSTVFVNAAFPACCPTVSPCQTTQYRRNSKKWHQWAKKRLFASFNRLLY